MQAGVPPLLQWVHRTSMAYRVTANICGNFWGELDGGSADSTEGLSEDLGK